VLLESRHSLPDAGQDEFEPQVQPAPDYEFDQRITEVTKLDVKVENGKVTQFRTRLSLSFKYGA